MTEPIFATSVDSKAIAAVLEKTDVGAVASYSAMSDAVGRDVRDNCRAAIATAVRMVQRDHRMVFAAVRNEGLKRLPDSDVVDLIDSTRDRIRRTARRTAKKLVCVDYDRLPKDKQTKHNTALSVLGVVGEMVSDKSIKRVASAVESGGQISLSSARAALAALGMQQGNTHDQN